MMLLLCDSCYDECSKSSYIPCPLEKACVFLTRLYDFIWMAIALPLASALVLTAALAAASTLANVQILR